MRALLVPIDEPRWRRLANEAEATLFHQWPEGHELVIMLGDAVSLVQPIAIQQHLHSGRHLLVLPPSPAPLSFGEVAVTSNRLDVVGHHQGSSVVLSRTLLTKWNNAGGIGSPSIVYHQRIATPLPHEVLATDEQGNVLLFSYRSSTAAGCLVISCLWLGSPAPGTDSSHRRMFLRLLLDWLEGQRTVADRPMPSDQPKLPEKLVSLAHLMAVVLAFHNGQIRHDRALPELERVAHCSVPTDHFETVCRDFVVRGVLSSVDTLLLANPAELEAYLQNHSLARAVKLLRAREALSDA